VLTLLNIVGLFAGIGGLLGLGSTTMAAQSKNLSRLLMLVAMAALGGEFAAVKRVGPRVLAAVLASVAFLVCLSLTLIDTLGI
jgi:uncharacterized membrane protein YadS